MSAEPSPAEPYRRRDDGVYAPTRPVEHRSEEYDPRGLDSLLAMQRRHFWYRGRHRLLVGALDRELGRRPAARRPAAIDLGGGCGGWLAHLEEHRGEAFRELALADSSRQALRLAAPVVGPSVKRYQVDLLDLGWRERWDVAFLLDVLEHIPDDGRVLREVAGALRPGGLLLVTAPALRFFWSYNDELVHHQRRYARADLARLADRSDLTLQDSRYFMFLLSPLLLASRLRRPALDAMSADEIAEHLRKTHRVPPEPLNRLLTLVLLGEAPVALRARLPWGSSVLGVFRKAPGSRR